MAVVVAVTVTQEGERTVLGFDIGASEEEPFWFEFLRSLVKRGLKGVVAAAVRTIFAQPN